MKKIIWAVLTLMVVAAAGSVAQEAEVKLKQPILVTSCGQSGGPIYLKVMLKKLKLDFDYNPSGSAADLAAKKASGAPYKTIFIVTGASLKGMGAAGVSMDDEKLRTAELIAEARKQGIKIVGAHVTGMKNRAQGAAPGDNSDEISIDTVCPFADLLFVKSEGNEDGRFTVISKDKKIPLFLYDKNFEMKPLLEKLFK